jgi:HNH endonuclease
MLTVDRAREVIDYNPLTGVLTWRVCLSSRRHPGAVAGTIDHNEYRRVRIDRKKYLAHRLAWLLTTGEWPRDQLDHINGDRDDNRIANLREVSQSQNQCNARQRRTSKAPYKGVSLHRSGKWAAQGGFAGSKRHLGLFDTPEAAHARYREVAQKAFGAFWRPQ